jgi:mycofactocin precursor
MSADIMPEDTTDEPAAGGTDSPGEGEATYDALLESLLVEEVSIDGMCGVY